MKKKMLVLALLLWGGVKAAYSADINGLTLTPSEDGTTLTITGTGDLTTNSDAVATEIKNTITKEDANFSTVIFKSAGESKATINNKIVWAVLYKGDENCNTKNNALTKLDMGDVVVSDLASKTFQGTTEQGFNADFKITELTLPLVKAVDGETVVPSHVLADNERSSWVQIPVTTLHIPEGYTKVGDKAFYNGKFTTVTFPTTLTAIGDEAFEYCKSITTLELNEGLKTIGNKAFHTAEGLTSVQFPTTLTSIGQSAFAICHQYTTITLNEGLQFIGNCAFYNNTVDKIADQTVLKVPGTVKYIGPGAFLGRLYRDAYFYGSKAPICPYGKLAENEYTNSTFEKVMYVGESGYKEPTTGYADRDMFVNTLHFCVLHYPVATEGDDIDTYADATRVYKTWGNTYYGKGNEANQYTVGSETDAPTFDGTTPGVAKVVDYGFKDTYVDEAYVWPSQSMFCRSYAVNSNGLKWDGVTPYTPSLTTEEIAMVKADVTNLAESSDADIQKVAYLGTRQFTLTDQDITTTNSNEYATSITKGGRWWTLCVPCDVTKDEVKKVFGEGTQLCLFSKVVRKEDATNGNELHFYFQNDTYKNKYTRNEDGSWTKGAEVSSDDDVVLYAHTPYMIRPTQNPSDGSKFIINNFELKLGDMQATILTVDGDESADPVKYSFVGNYRKNVTVPQYSYVYGTKDSKTQFWMYTGTKGTWGIDKCLVKRIGGGETDYKTFFKENTENGAKQISIFGDEADVTAIDKVVYHYGDEAEAPVYNLSGQLVNAQNGLAKGVYIKGGKKFVVK